MIVRTATATWNGDLKNGEGTMQLSSGPFTGEYTFTTRFENAPGTNPDEMLAAAHAGCFSMQLANLLAQAGARPERVETEAAVHLNMEGGPHIERIRLVTRVHAADVDADGMQRQAEEAKRTCPLSQALASVPIELEATLA